MNTASPVTDLLDECEEVASSGIKANVKIEDEDSFPAADDLHVAVPRWKRMRDVVAVVGDMKNSTALSFRDHPKTSARVYEAVTGNMVRVFDYYEPEFVDIQGDGVFALYHGDSAYERGLCAAISLMTFSFKRLDPLLKSLLPAEVPETGIKTGMAAGTLTAKRVGIRGTEEPVWAGRPVNWAVKCAQAADAHQLVVTSKVWEQFSTNDWVKWSCRCIDGSPLNRFAELWQPAMVPPLASEQCHQVESFWCDNCGDEFHEAILEGETKRDDIPSHYS